MRLFSCSLRRCVLAWSTSVAARLQAVRMRKCTWCRAGKPAVGQSGPGPGSICQACLHRGAVTEHITERSPPPAETGPPTPRPTHQAGCPRCFRQSAREKKAPSLHSFDWLINKTASPPATPYPRRAGCMLQRSGHSSLHLMGQPGEVFVCPRLAHILQRVRADNARTDGGL